MKYSAMCALLISMGGVSLADAASSVNATSMLGQYELIEFSSKNALVELPVEPALTLTISKGGKLSGFSGCNQYRGTLKSSPLSVGAVAATRKMCHDPSVMQLEQNFLSVLGKASKLERVAAGEIVFRDAENQSLRFKILPSKPVEKIIWIGPEKKPCSAGVMKTECLQYKSSAAAEWFNFYGQIEGFDWHAGSTYKLKVLEDKIPNPPADASAIKTTLIEILETK
ncbi:META and DUF4377 domain-containing protein [Chitinibacter bivalviorum]|uniref:META and DUF4377 domain-containing protein n=1 Tax=Chitinibacter bivalviorum TaxID=2739434 RepID=A0A7H9BHG4_9NEIS|nr:META and DUF4377 domain-containing protein [Chitinibacter bivalviorum]QLG87706.1 META and DUF4377 domain-containing protein [Chitinibacter bivalviorum]